MEKPRFVWLGLQSIWRIWVFVIGTRTLWLVPRRLFLWGVQEIRRIFVVFSHLFDQWFSLSRFEPQKHENRQTSPVRCDDNPKKSTDLLGSGCGITPHARLTFKLVAGWQFSGIATKNFWQQISLSSNRCWEGFEKVWRSSLFRSEENLSRNPSMQIFNAVVLSTGAHRLSIPVVEKLRKTNWNFPVFFRRSDMRTRSWVSNVKRNPSAQPDELVVCHPLVTTLSLVSISLTPRQTYCSFASAKPSSLWENNDTEL